MCNRFLLGEGLVMLSGAPAACLASEVEKAARYFPSADILAGEQMAFPKSHRLQFYSHPIV